MDDFSTQVLSYILTTETLEYALNPDIDTRFAERTSTEWNFSAGVDKFFKPAPTWQHVLVIWLLLVTGWVTNFLIIKIYWRLKSTNRIYVLAMAFMDLTNLTFALLPRFIILFLGQSLIREVVEVTRYAVAFFIFTLYMLLPLFLALDRFVAVSYPHKLKDKLQQIRRLKIGLVVYCFATVGAALTTELLFGIESFWFSVVQIHNIVILFLQVASALTLYVIIAVKVMRSRKQMKKHRSLNDQHRYPSSNVTMK